MIFVCLGPIANFLHGPRIIRAKVVNRLMPNPEIQDKRIACRQVTGQNKHRQ